MRAMGYGSSKVQSLQFKVQSSKFAVISCLRFNSSFLSLTTKQLISQLPTDDLILPTSFNAVFITGEKSAVNTLLLIFRNLGPVRKKDGKIFAQI